MLLIQSKECIQHDFLANKSARSLIDKHYGSLAEKAFMDPRDLVVPQDGQQSFKDTLWPCDSILKIHILYHFNITFQIITCSTTRLLPTGTHALFRVHVFVLFLQTCPNMSKHVQTCPGMSKHVQACPNMSHKSFTGFTCHWTCHWTCRIRSQECFGISWELALEKDWSFALCALPCHHFSPCALQGPLGPYRGPTETTCAQLISNLKLLGITWFFTWYKGIT